MWSTNNKVVCCCVNWKSLLLGAVVSDSSIRDMIFVHIIYDIYVVFFYVIFPFFSTLCVRHTSVKNQHKYLCFAFEIKTFTY